MHFVRNIDSRGWELHLRDPESGGNHTKYLSHGGSFINECKAGEPEIVKAMVERTQVELDARNEFDMTPLLYAAIKGYLRMVLCLCEQGADKEAKSVMTGHHCT